MWTILVVLCFVASFDVNVAERSFDAESSIERSDSTVEETPARLPRKFRGNSRTRRVHIENQHGFDGKVEKIHINSEEDLPGVRAYGLQKMNLANNGHIEKVIKKEAMEDVNDASRVTRSIEVYGMSKENLYMNGEIEKIHPPVPSSRYQAPVDSRIRLTRSIETESKQGEHSNDLEDLEAQDAKIFRPLFVYRQQVAKRQHRGRNQFQSFQPSQKSWYNHRLIF
ncbi:hypothetical protein ANTPLA_LOCUS3537 [Anthophora plagiata]